MIVRRYEAMELIAKASGDDPTAVFDMFEQAEGSYACLAQYVARAITLGVFGKGLRSARRPCRRATAATRRKRRASCYQIE